MLIELKYVFTGNYNFFRKGLSIYICRVKVKTREEFDTEEVRNDNLNKDLIDKKPKRKYKFFKNWQIVKLNLAYIPKLFLNHQNMYNFKTIDTEYSITFYFKWMLLRFRHLWINSKNGKISHDFPRHKSSWPNVYASLDSRLWWSFEVREKSAFSMRLEFALITSGMLYCKASENVHYPCSISRKTNKCHIVSFRIPPH